MSNNPQVNNTKNELDINKKFSQDHKHEIFSDWCQFNVLVNKFHYEVVNEKHDFDSFSKNIDKIINEINNIKTKIMVNTIFEKHFIGK